MRFNIRSVQGQSTLEYALILGLIAAAVMAGVMLFGNKLHRSYQHSSQEINRVNKP
jgi:Flp pilus assembly pilin Flp